MNQRIYKLEKVRNIKYSKGKFRLAGEDDMDIVLKYFIAFCEFIGEPQSLLDATKNVKQFLNTKSLFVWDDGGIVSMAKKDRPSKNGIVVNAVYTPEEYRGKGYATSCVAALSEHLLKTNKFCSLYTDLSNPTSNNIYSKIGYKPVSDSMPIEIIYNS